MRAILSMIGVRSLLLCLAGARSAAADSWDRCQALLAHPSRHDACGGVECSAGRDTMPTSKLAEQIHVPTLTARIHERQH